MKSKQFVGCMRIQTFPRVVVGALIDEQLFDTRRFRLTLVEKITALRHWAEGRTVPAN